MSDNDKDKDLTDEEVQQAKSLAEIINQVPLPFDPSPTVILCTLGILLGHCFQGIKPEYRMARFDRWSAKFRAALSNTVTKGN